MKSNVSLFDHSGPRPKRGFRTTSGLRMPAEWERHEATWLTWPTNRTTWPGKLLKEVEDIYIQMIAALLPGEKVHLLVPDAKMAKLVSKRLNGRKYPLSRLVFHEVKTVDTWIRDYGPIFVKKEPQVRSWKQKRKDVLSASSF